MPVQVLRLMVSNRGRAMIPTTYLVCQKVQKYATSQREGSNTLTKARKQAEVSTHVSALGEKIKENSKTASYMGIILFGVGVTGVMFYAIFRELFSSNSPNNIYSKALERVIDDTRVQDALGVPIKGFGEESRRRRRQHVAHTVYQRNNVNHMRMQFYVQGLRNKATVHLEMKENSAGKYEYRYLFVQLDYYPRATIILEDNRTSDNRQLDDSSLSSEGITPIV